MSTDNPGKIRAFFTSEANGIIALLGLAALALLLAGPFYLWRGWNEAAAYDPGRKPEVVESARVFKLTKDKGNYWATICWGTGATVSVIPITAAQYADLQKGQWLKPWKLPPGYGQPIAITVPPPPGTRDLYLGSAMTAAVIGWPLCFLLIHRINKWKALKPGLLLGPSAALFGLIMLIMPKTGLDPDATAPVSARDYPPDMREQYLDQMRKDEQNRKIRDILTGKQFPAFAPTPANASLLEAAAAPAPAAPAAVPENPAPAPLTEPLKFAPYKPVRPMSKEELRRMLKQFEERRYSPPTDAPTPAPAAK